MKREVCIPVFPAPAGIHRGGVQDIQKNTFEAPGWQQFFPWQKVNSEHSTTPHLGFPGRGDFLCSFLQKLVRNSEKQRFWLHSWQKGMDSLSCKVFLKNFFRKATRNWNFFLFQIHSRQKGDKPTNSSVVLRSSCPEKDKEGARFRFLLGYQEGKSFLWKHRKMSVFPISNT